MKPDSYFSDKELEYVSLDISIDEIEVLATCTNQPQPAKKLSKVTVQQILHQCIEKEKKYAATKNIRFGEWEPVKESSVSISSLATLSLVSEIAMPNTDIAATKKSVEKKSHLRVANILKKFKGATTITEQILDLRKCLIVGKLLAFVLVVEK